MTNEMRKLMEAVRLSHLNHLVYKHKGITHEYDPIPEGMRGVDGTISIFHFVKRSNGENFHINWSPRSYLDQEDFENWIIAGMPKYIDGQQINKENVKFEADLRRAGASYDE